MWGRVGPTQWEWAAGTYRDRGCLWAAQFSGSRDIVDYCEQVHIAPDLRRAAELGGGPERNPGPWLAGRCGEHVAGLLFLHGDEAGCARALELVRTSDGYLGSPEAGEFYEWISVQLSG